MFQILHATFEEGGGRQFAKQKTKLHALIIILVKSIYTQEPETTIYTFIFQIFNWSSQKQFICITSYSDRKEPVVLQEIKFEAWNEIFLSYSYLFSTPHLSSLWNRESIVLVMHDRILPLDISSKNVKCDQ